MAIKLTLTGKRSAKSKLGRAKARAGGAKARAGAAQAKAAALEATRLLSELSNGKPTKNAVLIVQKKG